MKLRVRLRVAGVDEAGRGPLAGPVVAAAVILNPARPIRGLADSKTLEPDERESLAVLIRDRALCYAVAWADAEEIDSIRG
jgi:ribonuclease HII